jgi:rSAM/selenodomain-associated transferase 2
MSLSIIVPTYNEKDNILKLLESIEKGQNGHVKEIIIVDSPLSTDKIQDLVFAPNVKLLVSKKSGRAPQMNFGAKIASGEILQFVHADTILPSHFDSDIIEAVNNGFVSGCFTYRFDSQSYLLKINAAFTNLPFLWCRGGDQAIFMDKKTFFLLGGFDEYYTIMEDYEFLKRINTSYTFKIIKKDLIVSSRKYRKNSWLKVQIANFKAMRMFYSGKFTPDQIKEFYQKTLNF